MKNFEKRYKRLSVSARHFFAYLRLMLERTRVEVGKVIKYISTPLHALTAIVLFLALLILFAPLVEISQYILIGLIALIIVVILGLLVFNHKRLQFTAWEQITWAREKLSDSSIESTYTIGQIELQKKPDEPNGKKQ